MKILNNSVFYYNRRKYFKNRGVDCKRWSIINQSSIKGYDFIIIIPSYAENNYLPKTLESISNNEENSLKSLLVIVVINNEENAQSDILKNNLNTYTYLANTKYNYTIAIIDAFTNGHALPKKIAGVGMARKIGMDNALHYSNNNTLFASLDADTLISENYLKTIRQYFEHYQSNAVVVGFAHQAHSEDKINNIVREYEDYLYETAKKLKIAGSPYGYVSIGSGMICTAEAYIAVGGMTNREAAEDFYFLQELAKYRSVDIIEDKIIAPSSRLSERVYLGTSARVKDALNGHDIEQLYFTDYSFEYLKKWIIIGQSAYRKDIEYVIEKCNVIDNELSEILNQFKIRTIWAKLQKSSPTEQHFIKQFNRWFDALKTIKFLKHFSKISKK